MAAAAEKEEDVHKWSKDRVQEYLLQRDYVDKATIKKLYDNDVDGELLVTLTEDTMKNGLNISSWGNRKHLLNVIDELVDKNNTGDLYEYLVKDYGVGHYLKAIPLLENLSSNDRAAIGANVTRKKFKDGEVVVRQGARQEMFYIVRDGTAVVKLQDPVSSRIRVIARLHPGDFFGENGLVNAERAPANLVCEKAMTAWCVCIKYARSVLRKSRVLNTLPHREAISAEDSACESIEQPQNVIREKTKETKEIIETALRKNVLFESITDEQLNSFVENMWRRDVEAKQYVIRQGEPGDFFYVIQSGEFEIFVHDANGLQVSAGKQGPVTSFGGLALMYNAPRAACVRASRKSVVWALHRQNFRRILFNQNCQQMQKRESFLRSVPIFRFLVPTEISVLATACDSKVCEPGETIVTQGEENGDTFYIIERGSVKVIKDGVETDVLKEGSFFGERALLHDIARTATVTTVERTRLLVVNRHAFCVVLGPLKDIMTRQEAKYEGGEVAKVQEKPVQKFKGINLEEIKHSDLESICILGSGAFGEVRLVKIKNSPDLVSFALKKIKKTKVRASGQIVHIHNERHLMMAVNYPFLVRLYQTFESPNYIYFLMEPCLGGELFTYLRDNGAMEESDARFYIAGVICAIHHLHSKMIVYRDLKPENTMLNDKGYVKICDFGFAKQIKSRTYTLCGTPDYLAPEVITGKGHSFAVDWWTIGILCYELLHAFPPFYTANHMKTYRRILREKVKYTSSFSSKAKSFIGALCKKKPSTRLGVCAGGLSKVKNHPFFDKFDWEALEAQTMPAPLVPTVTDSTDASNFDDYPDPTNGALEAFEISDFSAFN